MERLEKFLINNDINFFSLDNYIVILQKNSFNYLKVFKVEHPIYDYLYIYFQPKNKRGIVVNYSYLVNIVIKNFIK